MIFYNSLKYSTHFFDIRRDNNGNVVADTLYGVHTSDTFTRGINFVIYAKFLTVEMEYFTCLCNKNPLHGIINSQYM